MQQRNDNLIWKCRQCGHEHVVGKDLLSDYQKGAKKDKYITIKAAMKELKTSSSRLEARLILEDVYDQGKRNGRKGNHGEKK